MGSGFHRPKRSKTRLWAARLLRVAHVYRLHSWVLVFALGAGVLFFLDVKYSPLLETFKNTFRETGPWLLRLVEPTSPKPASRENLEAENAALKEALALQTNLAMENQTLKEDVFFQGEARPFQTYAVATYLGDAQQQGLLLQGGESHGLKIDQAMETVHGVVGRIIAVGKKTATGLLITDGNSRVPAIILNKNVPGIVAGDNTPTPSLILTDPDKIEVGDVVVTSGSGGVFCPGRLLGTVSQKDKGSIRITPAAPLGFLRHVSVFSTKE